MEDLEEYFDEEGSEERSGKEGEVLSEDLGNNVDGGVAHGGG